jgi:hypothetical protein
MVPENCKKPSCEIGAGAKAVDAIKGSYQSFLHKVIRAVDISREGDGKRAQTRHRGQHGVSQCGI